MSMTAILTSGPPTGAGVNPAWAIGPMTVAPRFTDWWACLGGLPRGGTVVARPRQRVFLLP